MKHKITGVYYLLISSVRDCVAPLALAINLAILFLLAWFFLFESKASGESIVPQIESELVEKYCLCSENTVNFQSKMGCFSYGFNIHVL
jgi:hypothetical protein